MQFVVESAGVADGLALAVPPPQSRRRRLTVGAGGAGSPGRRLGRHADRRSVEVTTGQQSAHKVCSGHCRSVWASVDQQRLTNNTGQLRSWEIRTGSIFRKFPCRRAE